MKPIVSIIIPAFNEQKNIARAIKSAQMQSTDNIEIIVVDDGSSDNTPHIVSRILSTDNRIKLISHPTNQGLSQSRLDGINEACGDYIFFLDADDIISPDAIELLHDKALKTNCDIILGGAQRISRRLHIKVPYFKPQIVMSDDTCLARDLLPILLSKQNMAVNAWGRLFSRKLLTTHFTHAEKNFMGEDMILNVTVFNTAAQVSYIENIIYGWTMAGKSLLTPELLWQQNQLIFTRCIDILSQSSHYTTAIEEALKLGLTNDLIASTSRLMLSPFISKSAIKKWVTEQLHNCPHIQQSPDNIIASAKKHISKHRLFYLAMTFLEKL